MIFGERTGASSPRVLALHGWRNDHTNLVAVVRDFDAITLDLPGFGRSPVPSSVWGAEGYARAVAPVLDDFDEPAVVLAHSFGGRLALHLALMRPEKVKALVLTGVPLVRRSSPTSSVPLAYKLAKWANKVGLLSDYRMEAERRKRGSADYNAATGIMRDIFVKVVNESYEPQLRKVHQPVELVWGENDTAAPLGQARYALELLANGKLTVVSGGDHFIVASNPRPIREAIERHLS